MRLLPWVKPRIILKRLEQTTNSDWKSASIDIHKRRNKRIRYLEELVQFDGYGGTLRQFAVKELGREQPTLFLANHPGASPREMITNYARSKLRL